MDRATPYGKLGDLVVLVGRDPFYWPLARFLWEHRIAVLRIDRGEALPRMRDTSPLNVAVVYRPDKSGTGESRVKRWAEGLSPVQTFVKLGASDMDGASDIGGASDIVVATVHPSGSKVEEWITALPALVELATAVPRRNGS